MCLLKSNRSCLGKYAGDVIRRRVAGQSPLDPFWYWDKGDLAVVGREFAAADLMFWRHCGDAVPLLLLW